MTSGAWLPHQARPRAERGYNNPSGARSKQKSGSMRYSSSAFLGFPLCFCARFSSSESMVIMKSMVVVVVVVSGAKSKYIILQLGRRRRPSSYPGFPRNRYLQVKPESYLPIGVCCDCRHFSPSSYMSCTSLCTCKKLPVS